MKQFDFDSEWLTKHNATPTQLGCPKCGTQLLSAPRDDGIIVWCAMPDSICPCHGANEGGFGKNENAAFTVLTQKLSFGK